jgi:PPOX class probable F420-dependent enzyme
VPGRLTLRAVLACNIPIVGSLVVGRLSGMRRRPAAFEVARSAMLPEHDAFLRAHRWALLSTTRAGGAPQVSMVAYHYDGADLVISCRRASAKFVNAVRDPRVVVAIADDRRYVAIAGTAHAVTAGASLVELTLRLLSSLLPTDAAVLQHDVDEGLEQVGRAVLRIAPEHVLGRI